MDRQDTAKISFDVESRFRDYFKYLTTVVKGRDIANAVRLSLGVQILNSATEVYIRMKRANRKKSIGDKIRLANEADELWDDTKALMKLFCGYKVFLHHFEPKTATVRRSERRIRKKLRMYENGEITLKQLEDTCDSFKKSYLKHTTVTSNPVLEDAYTFIALKKQELGLVEIEKRKGKEVSVLPVRGAEW